MNSKLQFRLDSEEQGLLRSVLNEVLNGFEVPEFERRIGMNSADLEQLLKHLQTLGNRDAVTLDIQQTRAFRNALSEAIRELGVEEFHTRTGYDFGQGNATLQRLDQLLGTGDP
jgi:hypothetical protein